MKIDMSQLSTVAKKAAKNLTVLFWAGFFLILVFDALTIKKAVGLVLESRKIPPAPITARGARIDFAGYDANLSRVESASKFVPSPEAGMDPFTGQRTGAQAGHAKTEETAATSTTSTTTPAGE